MGVTLCELERQPGSFNSPDDLSQLLARRQPPAGHRSRMRPGPGAKALASPLPSVPPSPAHHPGGVSACEVRARLAWVSNHARFIAYERISPFHAVQMFALGNDFSLQLRFLPAFASTRRCVRYPRLLMLAARHGLNVPGQSWDQEYPSAHI